MSEQEKRVRGRGMRYSFEVHVSIDAGRRIATELQDDLQDKLSELVAEYTGRVRGMSIHVSKVQTETQAASMPAKWWVAEAGQ